MLRSDLDHLTPIQRLIIEQAYVMAEELEAAADSASEGPVVDRFESFLLGNSRNFFRKVLESTLQKPSRSSRKEGGAARICLCGTSGRHKGNATKTVITALGAIALWRPYFSSLPCDLGG